MTHKFFFWFVSMTQGMDIAAILMLMTEEKLSLAFPLYVWVMLFIMKIPCLLFSHERPRCARGKNAHTD